MISSFRVRNYRQFRDLQVDGLKRLNLIVGENSVGKTALLEALWLHVNIDALGGMRDVLALRGEIASQGIYSSNPSDLARSPLSSLTPWPPKKGANSYFFMTSDNNKYRIFQIDMTNYNSGVFGIVSSYLDKLQADDFNIDGGRSRFTSPYITHDSLSTGLRLQSKRGNNVLVPAYGLTPEFVREFWDKVALTEHEDDVDAAVQLLEPKIQRISFTSTGAQAKLKGAPAPVPMNRLGEGMSRLFALALAIVNAKDGVLLIDEIETGLYRSTLDRMWKFLFTLAHRFNVQLFATTHSWDCISSFAAAAKATQEDDGALVRLERKSSKVVAVVYDEVTLASATEQGIEVR